MSARVSWLRLSLAAVSTALASAAAAQTPAAPPRLTQEVVVTATASPMPADALGRTVTILTRQEIEQLGIPSVIDALRLATDLDVEARGPHDIQTDFSLRGATFGQSLVLADGIRLNDSQTGHHDGDIPVPMVAVGRIEIVPGAGSAVHGADALGGTINVITRDDDHANLEVDAGQHGYTSAQGSVSGHGMPAHWLLAGWASRSDGFIADRGFAQGGALLRGPLAHGWTVDVRRQKKAFGAAGFYGASPSKEWTDQTIASGAWRHQAGQWSVEATGVWRGHGDHFLWDLNRPGFAENRHRTSAGDAALNIERGFSNGARVTVGGDAGRDAITSNNLGDHRYWHGSAYGEAQLPIAARVTAQAGVRVDRVPRRSRRRRCRPRSARRGVRRRP